LLAILGFVVAIIIAGNERAKTESQNRGLREQNKQLQEKNKQLNKELKDAQTAKLQRQEQARVESARLAAMQRVRSSAGGTCEQYRPLFSQYSWNIEIALAVCQAESGGDPNIVSATNDFGLMQLHNIPIKDPAQNIAYAYNEKYLKGGWGHWSVCNNGTVKCW